MYFNIKLIYRILRGTTDCRRIRKERTIVTIIIPRPSAPLHIKLQFILFFLIVFSFKETSTSLLSSSHFFPQLRSSYLYLHLLQSFISSLLWRYLHCQTFPSEHLNSTLTQLYISNTTLYSTPDDLKVISSSTGLCLSPLFLFPSLPHHLSSAFTLSSPLSSPISSFLLSPLVFSSF